MPGLLALDTSVHVGWAYFPSRHRSPRCGTWHAPTARPGLYGVRFNAYRQWLDKMLHDHPLDVLAFETPISQFAGRRDQHVTRLLLGFTAIAEELAYTRGLRCLEFWPSEIKLRLAGHGHASGDKMIAAATRLGFAVADDHQADACAIGLCAFDHIATVRR